MPAWPNEAVKFLVILASRHRDWTSDCACKGRRGTSTVQRPSASANLSTNARVRFCTKLPSSRFYVPRSLLRAWGSCCALEFALLRGPLASATCVCPERVLHSVCSRFSFSDTLPFATTNGSCSQPLEFKRVGVRSLFPAFYALRAVNRGKPEKENIVGKQCVISAK